MNSYQLGKVGITLLAVYLAVRGIQGAAQMLTSTAHSWVALDLALEDLVPLFCLAFFTMLVFGLVPAGWLLFRRRPLARRWCASDDAGAAPPISGYDLLRIALVVFAIGVVVNSTLSLVYGIGFAVVSMLGSESAGILAPTSTGTLASATAGIILGILLLRRSSQLADAWASAAA